MKAVVLSAGLGTRLKPLTNNLPKALVKIGNQTLLERAVRYLQKFGIDEFVINIHHFGGQIMDFLEVNQNLGVKIHISDERDQLLDTGGGLVAMEEWLNDETFVIYNVDVLTEMDLQAMMNFHYLCGALATLAVSNRQSGRFLLFDDRHQLKGWLNTRTGEKRIMSESNDVLQPLAFSGIHIVEPEIFHFKPVDKVFSIIDWYLELAKYHQICGYDHTGSFWLDAGKLSVIEEATQYIGEF
ncbi:MAG: nucleotidyltransferase family protein [Candidatus Marinimicrobia bacterium]|nr:nucleotidyltransferase family protein [Candidatus Neomarinimicrobiota bacterium]